MKEKELAIAALQEKIHQLQTWANDCRSMYDTLVARDKNLEKNFKKDFPDVSQVVMEQLTKFYKYVQICVKLKCTPLGACLFYNCITK